MPARPTETIMKRFIYVALVIAPQDPQEIYIKIWTECPLIALRSQVIQREELELQVNPLLQKDPESQRGWGVKFLVQPVVQEKNPKFIV